MLDAIGQRPIRLLEAILSLQMAALGGLLVGGLLSVRPLLVIVPTLTHSSTLVFLESLSGTFEASRAKGGLGLVGGMVLFCLAAIHALWLVPRVRSISAHGIAAVLSRPIGQERVYASLKEESTAEASVPNIAKPIPTYSFPPPPVKVTKNKFDPNHHDPYIRPNSMPSPTTMLLSA